MLKTEFDSKLVYRDDKKYIKTKIETYGDSVITNFHNNKVPNEKSPSKCLSILTLDSVIKANKRYYPQKILEECKNKQKRIKIENLTDDDLEQSESDDNSNDETESDIDIDEFDQ